ncbi:Autophagy-related protein 16 [Penicillium angulare]|uniref:Autophagy-related protein 16 n=1 Tax=Penicillium angulare TaxID=116970 RepID=A0A9W9FVB6_9EURO|nr:Autophagy-related protein 16 [Penicillium angulare]
MANWREEYLAALAVRDQKEKANVALYDAYTRLADRTASLTTQIGAEDRPAVEQSPSTHNEAFPSAGASKKQTAGLGPSPTELLNATRADLIEAQRSRSELQDKLNEVTTEVEKLRKKNTKDGQRISILESERLQIHSRLKDRDEELRGKAKLLEDFQDEMATLNLQLNMADEKSNKLQRENQELVDRWMTRMGLEADAMNDASKFS